MNNNLKIQDIQMGMWYKVEIEENDGLVYNANFKIVSNGIEIVVNDYISEMEGFVSIVLNSSSCLDLNVVQMFATKRFHGVMIKRDDGEADGLLSINNGEIIVIELGDEMLDIRCYWIRNFLSLDYKDNILIEEKAGILFESCFPSTLMMNS